MEDFSSFRTVNIQFAEREKRFFIKSGISLLFFVIFSVYPISLMLGYSAVGKNNKSCHSLICGLSFSILRSTRSQYHAMFLRLPSALVYIMILYVYADIASANTNICLKKKINMSSNSFQV